MTPIIVAAVVAAAAAATLASSNPPMFPPQGMPQPGSGVGGAGGALPVAAIVVS